MAEEHEVLETLLKVQHVYPPPPHIVEQAYIKDYDQAYRESIADPERFWDGVARELEWISPWAKVLDWQYPWAKWFVGATCNIVQNCLDRHVKSWRKNKVAVIWVGEEGQERIFTYAELSRQVNKCANALKSLGLRQGDRVTIYLPKIPEQIVAMLACARLGIIHSVVYSGFSAPALEARIRDAEARLVITADFAYDRGKTIALKPVVDEAVAKCQTVERVVVVQREPSTDRPLDATREIDWHAWLAPHSTQCDIVPLDSEAPLYILYTSGTTGKPKGVVHVHGGYMVGTYITTKYVFDLKDEDIYFCVADPGWVTGHSYIVYGPLLNGATILTAEGKPDYPDPGRWWSLIERYGVTVFYTTPTAIRLLMKYGEGWPAKYDLSSLKILGSVGEPINPEAWEWFYRVTGSNKPIMDTWWQTETGMIMVTPLPCTPLKPGSAGRPFLGIEADVMDRDGHVIDHGGGFAVIKTPWPAMMRTIYKDPDRYLQYWNTIPGVYTTGDVCHKDEDGYLWFMGRADDVVKVAGNRIGTAEVESALVGHDAVVEAAVIGKPHKTAGEMIKAFVVLKQGVTESPELIQSLKDHVLKELGKIAVPQEIEIVPSLPKTRSGKIMRRLLKAKELGQDPGDISTLEE